MQIKKQRLSKFLGKLELAVMEIVWKSDQVSVADVVSKINRGDREFAYTTIMTVMQRLNRKGWLAVDKSGRAYLYRAALAPQEAEADAISKILRGLLKDHGDLAIAQFMSEFSKITPEQLDKLDKLAKQKGK